MSRYTVEFVGTFVFFFSILISSRAVGPKLAPVLFSSVLALVASLGGGDYNPAVSVMTAWSTKNPAVLIRIIPQVIAGILSYEAAKMLKLV